MPIKVFASATFVATTVDILNVGANFCKSPWLKTNPWSIAGGLALGAALSHTASLLQDRYLNEEEDVKVTILPAGPNSFPDDTKDKKRNRKVHLWGPYGESDGSGIRRPVRNYDGSNFDDWEWKSVMMDTEVKRYLTPYLTKVINGEISNSEIENLSKSELLKKLGVKPNEVDKYYSFINYYKRKNCGGSEKNQILSGLESIQNKLYPVVQNENLPVKNNSTKSIR